MTVKEISRRRLLEGAAAMGMLAVPASTVLGQSSRKADTMPVRREFVIRGAHVLTMDPKIADLPTGDVHVRNGAIVAVGAKLEVRGAQVIDGRGMICMPGFVDSHWHLWTSLFRPYVRADINEFGYFPVSNRLGQQMAPQDSYISVKLGVAEALSAGVTCVHNWAHNVRSPEHADAELSAMRDTGIRGRFAYGPAQGMADDRTMDLEGLAKTKAKWIPAGQSSSDGMLTMGICSRNVGAMSIGGAARGVLSIDMVKKDWGGARALGLPITVHTSGPSP
ncbi:unnamed protein product, partial [Phaeothamnion confervicola]